MSGASRSTFAPARSSLVDCCTLIVKRFTPLESEMAIVCAESLSAMSSPNSVRRIFVGCFAGAPFSSDGTSEFDHQLPLQTGREASPASNSIQTPAPIGGRVKKPTPGPAYGPHGNAQPGRVLPSTPGTHAF